MAAGEAYDVVVVRDPTMTVGRIMTLSRDLAHLTGVKQADVELAMQQGRFVVYAALPQERVDAATQQLRTMGAVVRVQPAQQALQLESLEPDRERLAPSSGYGGPVAHFADGDLGLDPGAFNTSPGARLGAPPTFNEGIGQVIDDDGRTNRYEPVAHQGPSLGPVDDMAALASGLDAASLDAPAVTTIDGMDGAAFDAEEKAAREEAVPEVSQAPKPDVDEPLTLDVDAPAGLTPVGSPNAAVGVARNPPEESLRLALTPGGGAAQPQGVMPRLPAPAAPAQAAASAASSPYMAVPRGDMPQVAEKRGLLFEDTIANALACVAITSLLGIMVAFGVTRGKRDAATTLETELSSSLRNPGDVSRGDRRSPDVVQADLEGVYDDAQLRFLLVLFGLGIPGGIGLSFIRR